MVIVSSATLFGKSFNDDRRYSQITLIESETGCSRPIIYPAIEEIGLYREPSFLVRSFWHFWGASCEFCLVGGLDTLY